MMRRLLAALGLLVATTIAAAAAEPFRIEVSMRLDNISGFSPREKTYAVDGTLWLACDAALMRTLEERGIDPVELVLLQNLVNPWDAAVEPLAQRRAGSDGRVVRGYRFVGTFYSNEIDYRHFPFGGVTLSVVVEPRVGAADRLDRGLVLAAAPDGGELGSRAGLSGYELSRWAFVDEPYRRVTHIAGGAAAVESRVAFHVYYAANASAAAVKWVLPLAVVMLIMLLTPSLTGALISERLTVPPMILLSIALMQQSYRDTLPPIPYLTFLDKLYACSLIVTLVFFVVFIWAANAMRTALPADAARQLRRINRVDLATQGIAIGGYILLIALSL